jgi:hypothetical protein
MHRLLVLLASLLLLLPALIATALPQTPTPQLTSSSKIQNVINQITPELITTSLKYLTELGTRTTGTYGCSLAADYIASQFTHDDLAVRLQNFTHMKGNQKIPRYYTGQNVIATLPGTTTNPSYLMFNAHYDCSAKSAGGNDDGSGTVAVLAAAYALSQFSFNRTIRFITFAGEEQGLLGSRAYATEALKAGDDILLEINADMIGRAVTTTGTHSGSLSETEDAGFGATAFHAVNDAYIGFTLSDRRYNHSQSHWGGSDYGPIVNMGWESIACWESDPDPNMHTPADNITNVNIPYLTNYTKLIAGALAVLADTPVVPPQVRLVSPAPGTLSIHGRHQKDIDIRKTTCINDVWIYAQVFHPSSPIIHVDFYQDGKLKVNDTTEPYAWHFQTRSIRTHTITIVAYDAEGHTTSTTRDIRIINLWLRK